MKKVLFCLVLLLTPSTAFADISPLKPENCDDCFRNFDCCTMKTRSDVEIAGPCSPGCSKETYCADYIAKHSGECSEKSCSAMMYSSGQPGVWALLLSLIFAILIAVRWRKS